MHFLNRAEVSVCVCVCGDYYFFSPLVCGCVSGICTIQKEMKKSPPKVFSMTTPKGGKKEDGGGKKGSQQNNKQTHTHKKREFAYMRVTVRVDGRMCVCI